MSDGTMSGAHTKQADLRPADTGGLSEPGLGERGLSQHQAARPEKRNRPARVDGRPGKSR